MILIERGHQRSPNIISLFFERADQMLMIFAHRLKRHPGLTAVMDAQTGCNYAAIFLCGQ